MAVAPGETNTDNNCSDAVPITVIEPSPVEIQKETRCGWDFSFNPFNFGWRFKLEGTVTAIHTADAVTVKGFRQLPKLRWKALPGIRWRTRFRQDVGQRHQRILHNCSRYCGVQSTQHYKRLRL